MSVKRALEHRGLHRGLVFGGSLGVYLFTLAPGVMWGDSAKYVLQAEGFRWPIDAGYHPLYALLSAIWMKLCPLSEPAQWLNASSALLGATACWILYELLRVEGVRSWVAVVVALGVGFSHVQWHVSVMAESYALSLVGFLGLLFYLRVQVIPPGAADSDPEATPPARRLFVAAFLGGLLISNFLLAIAYVGVLLPVAAFALHRRSGGLAGWPASVAALLSGLILGMILIWLPLTVVVLRGEMSLSDGLGVALNGRYATAFFWEVPAAALRRLVLLGGVTGYEFPSALLLFGLVGVVQLLRESRLWTASLIALSVGTYLFCSTYMIQRALFVLLPAFVLWGYFGGVGAERILASRRRFPAAWRAAVASIVILPLVVYPAVVTTFARTGWNPVPGRDLAYRDNVRYFLLPSKRAYRGPELFSREAFATVPKGGCLVADFTPHVVLRYYQRGHDLGAGVEVRFSETVRESTLGALLEEYVDGGKGLYLADDEPGAYPVEWLPDAYRIEAVGRFYRVVRN